MDGDQVVAEFVRFVESFFQAFSFKMYVRGCRLLGYDASVASGTGTSSYVFLHLDGTEGLNTIKFKLIPLFAQNSAFQSLCCYAKSAEKYAPCCVVLSIWSFIFL